MSLKRHYYLIVGLLAVPAALLYTWILRSGPEPLPAGAQLVPALTAAAVTPREGVLQARVELPPEREEAWEEALLVLGPALFPPGPEPVVKKTENGCLFHDPSGGMELALALTAQGGRARLLAQATLRDVDQLPKLERHWQQVFSSYGLEAQYAALLAGTLPGRAAYNEIEALLGNIFQSLDVRQTWQTTDGLLVSWAGHSPRIKSFVRDVRGEPVNVQAAARYHPLDNRTHIYLGSPLIYRDY